MTDFRNDSAMQTARQTAKRVTAPSPPVIDMGDTGTPKAERITLQYRINFDYSFDVAGPVSQPEFIQLVQDAMVELSKQMPGHLRDYPELVLKELLRRKLVDLSSFSPPPDVSTH